MFHRQRTYPPETRASARRLRRAGLTYGEILVALEVDIPKPTLSGWLRDIELTTEQKARIKQIELDGAAKGHPLGALWNREQKKKRLEEATAQALPIAKRLTQDIDALKLMAAALYIGEGAKADDAFSFCNSDEKVIRAWVALLRRNFVIDESKFACSISISEGMDESSLKVYWSEITGIPLNQFHKSSVDKRPNKKPRAGYKGVCVVVYYSLAVRRFLDALAVGVIDELLDSSSPLI